MNEFIAVLIDDCLQYSQTQGIWYIKNHSFCILKIYDAKKSQWFRN